MPVSGEITVIALAITVRPSLKTINNWLQIVSTTFHLAIFRSCNMTELISPIIRRGLLE